MSKSIFCGREADLDRLEQLFRRAAEHDGEPQVAVILAESGLGKTRLVQEFFGRLAAHRDPGHYWPSELRILGDNLDVNPDEARCRAEAEPNFLWWGIRFVDAEERNVVAAAMDGELASLATHLSMAMKSARDKDKLKKSLEAIGDAGLDAVLDTTGGGLYKTGATFLKKMWGIGKEFLADQPPPSLDALRQREQASKAERIVASLKAVMAARQDRLPICIFADDGHFAGADPESVDLLKRFLEAARADRWPLLMVITHWEKEWHADESPISQWLKPQSERITPLPLGKVDDLSPMLASRFPGLLPAQSKAILQRVDGNPQFLDEIMATLALGRSGKYFEGLNQAGPLTAAGLAAVLVLSSDRHKLVGERMEEAGPGVRQALSIGSLQGMRFLQDLTAEICEATGNCDLTAAEAAIGVAERPFALVRRDPPAAEFLQRLYHEVAAEELKGHPNESTIRAALSAGLRRRIHEPAMLYALPQQERLAVLGLAWAELQASELPEDANLAAEAAAMAIEERLQRSELLAAGQLAKALVARMRASREH